MQVHINTVHQLVFGGDWACAHGDAGGLSDVVRQLVPIVAEGLRRDLITIRSLANLPGGDPFAAWATLRPTLVESLRDDDEPDPSGLRC